MTAPRCDTFDVPKALPKTSVVHILLKLLFILTFHLPVKCRSRKQNTYPDSTNNERMVRWNGFSYSIILLQQWQAYTCFELTLRTVEIKNKLQACWFSATTRPFYFDNCRPVRTKLSTTFCRKNHEKEFLKNLLTVCKLRMLKIKFKWKFISTRRSWQIVLCLKLSSHTVTHLWPWHWPQHFLAQPSQPTPTTLPRPPLARAIQAPPCFHLTLTLLPISARPSHLTSPWKVQTWHLMKSDKLICPTNQPSDFRV